MDKLDEKYQRLTSVQSLMESAGMRVLKQDLADDLAYAEVEIESDKKNFINESKLAKLNFDLGRKAGLEMVLNRLDEYKDELVGHDVKPGKE